MATYASIRLRMRNSSTAACRNAEFGREGDKAGLVFGAHLAQQVLARILLAYRARAAVPSFHIHPSRNDIGGVLAQGRKTFVGNAHACGLSGCGAIRPAEPDAERDHPKAVPNAILDGIPAPDGPRRRATDPPFNGISVPQASPGVDDFCKLLGEEDSNPRFQDQ